ncbi:MAG: hypothetical protein WCJ30_21905 [Deltaproteobacteria bacterium]
MSPDCDEEERRFQGSVRVRLDGPVVDSGPGSSECRTRNGAFVPVAGADVPVGQHPFRSILNGTLGRSYALEDPEAIAVPGRGWAYAFRLHGAMYFGWVSNRGAPQGDLMPIATGHRDVGPPRLAWNGRQVAVAFALAGARGGSPSALSVARADPFGSIGRPARVPTTDDTSASEFRPSIVGLRDGTWLITWARGPVVVTPRTPDLQQVYVRRYDADFGAVLPAVLVSGDLSASDARAAMVGDRVVVAMLAGRESVRAVRTVSGRLGFGPAVPPLAPLSDDDWDTEDPCMLAHPPRLPTRGTGR